MLKQGIIQEEQKLNINSPAQDIVESKGTLFLCHYILSFPTLPRKFTSKAISLELMEI